MENNYHVPVMLNECLEGLAIKTNGIYVDVTFGGGGHSREILKKLNDKGVLVAFDQDEAAKQNLITDRRFVFIDQNFEYLQNHLQYQELTPVDGILADLGVSSHQFDVNDRGFSFRFDDALLDMRMDKQSHPDAAFVINNYTGKLLSDVFYLYGELKNSRQLAAAIEAYRVKQPIKTVADFKAAIFNHTPKFNEYKFYAQVFQALRIEVNREMEVLKSLLVQAANVLKPNGRMVVMSYHSLEDRLVKNFFNTGNFNGVEKKDFYGNVLKPFKILTKKVATANQTELDENSRARSAKLRIATKL